MLLTRWFANRVWRYSQEGRGIGLANKVAAYALQDGGLDTVDANRHLGFDDDLRSYEAVEFILNDMGIKVRRAQRALPFVYQYNVDWWPLQRHLRKHD